MPKISEVMTQVVITCPSDASVADAAALMRDHDIGNVLVVEDGKLAGIVTDRDLALHALTSNEDMEDMPIHKLMSKKVITGDANWSLEQAAKVMAKHQIRRLPIVDHGRLAGILSLGDLARYSDRKGVVKESLEAISTPNDSLKRMKHGGSVAGFILAGLAAAGIAWINWTESGRMLRKQMEESNLYHTAKQAVGTMRNKMDDTRASF